MIERAETGGMTERVINEIPTGEALFKARLRVGHSIASAAMSLHIPPSALADYESGMRTPGDNLINEMADLYGVERHRLASRPWVPQVPPEYHPETNTLSMGWHTIQVHPGDNEHLIRSVAAVVRSMRSLAETSPVQLRELELPLLAKLIDLTDPKLPNLFGYYLGIGPDAALQLVNEMVATVGNTSTEDDAAEVPEVRRVADQLA